MQTPMLLNARFRAPSAFRSPWCCIALGLATATLVPRMVQAYVCARVQTGSGQSGPSLSWYTRTPTFTFHIRGAEDLSGDTEFQVLRNSFARWEGVSACSSPQLMTDIQFRERALTDADRIGYNYLDPEANENLIIFRHDQWPHASAGIGVIALTTTTFVPLSGEMLDADIEFNAADLTFSTNQSPTTVDLENTAVHEVGHFVGLAHSADPEATMYARASPDAMGTPETKKRTLACDDQNAVTFKYPAGADNGYCGEFVDASCGYCAPPQPLERVPEIRVAEKDANLDGGCSVTGGATPLLGIVGLLLWRPRRRC